MANKGRSYPRAFRRDYGLRDHNEIFSYLADRIVCRMSGPQWAAFGMPLTDMISEPAIVNEPLGQMRWIFNYTSTIYPTMTFHCDWNLTFGSDWYQPYWLAYVSPTLYRYNSTPLTPILPISWPQVNGFNWKKPDGSADLLMSITTQRAATWAD